jgi:hypothetical protein
MEMVMLAGLGLLTLSNQTSYMLEVILLQLQWGEISMDGRLMDFPQEVAYNSR